MNNWKKISDFITFSTKGITPKYVENSSIVVLNQKCIRNGIIDYSFSQFTDDTKQISETKFVKKGDILINSTGVGTAGRCAFVDELPTNKRLITDSHILLLRCNNYFEARCLSYLLFSFEKTLMSYMTGSSGQGELDKVVVLNLLTRLPVSSKIQQKIAKVLSDLDAKIELNNKINAELEAMAKLIYDYWFVQFEFPNEDGKPYKSSGGKMVWNEELKREVPEGWEVNDLGFFELYQPKTISEKVMTNVGFYVFGANGIIGKYSEYNHAHVETVVTCRGNSCGNIIRTLPKSWITGNAMVIKAKNQNIVPEFIFQMLHWVGIHKVISGSGQPQITRTNLQTLKFVLPNDECLIQYKEFVDPICKKRINLIEENQELAELRDWLLPMLMNGQVKVK